MVVDSECSVLSNEHSVSRIGVPIYWLRLDKGVAVSPPHFPESLRRKTVLQSVSD
jgi:hypothetical protein